MDYDLVIPNEALSLKKGAIKAIQTPAWAEVQSDLLRQAEKHGIPCDVSWSQLAKEQKKLGH